MIVKELIQKLKKMPQDAAVKAAVDCNWFETTGVSAMTVSYASGDETTVSIAFDLGDLEIVNPIDE